MGRCKRAPRRPARRAPGIPLPCAGDRSPRAPRQSASLSRASAPVEPGSATRRARATRSPTTRCWTSRQACVRLGASLGRFGHGPECQGWRGAACEARRALAAARRRLSPRSRERDRRCGVELHRVDEAHEEIPHVSAILAPVEERILPVEDGLLESSLAHVVVQRRAGLSQEERQLRPMLPQVLEGCAQAGVRLHSSLPDLLLEPPGELLHYARPLEIS